MRPGATMPSWWGAPVSYLRAVVDDLRFPGRYPAVREALESELGEGRAEVPELHARLAVLDPVAAARMEPSNERRVVRALEVTLGSGQPFSTFGPGLEAYPRSPVTMVGLTVPTEEVDRRIAERFGRWMEEGLLDEVRALAARPGGISRTARQALGYRELLAHVEEGAPLDACMEEAVRRTRSFARRQASWFRRDPRIRWTEGGQDPADLLDRSPGGARIAVVNCETGGVHCQQTRRGGERLHRRARSRRHPPAFGGPGAPALRSAAGCRGRRDHPGRTRSAGL